MIRHRYEGYARGAPTIRSAIPDLTDHVLTHKHHAYLSAGPGPIAAAS